MTKDLRNALESFKIDMLTRLEEENKIYFGEDDFHYLSYAIGVKREKLKKAFEDGNELEILNLLTDISTLSFLISEKYKSKDRVDFDLLLVDLDGTIRRSAEGNKFINSPVDQEPIPESQEKIKKLFEKDVMIWGISNQAGINAGYKTCEQTIQEMFALFEMIPELSGVSFCPDFKGEKLVKVFNNEEGKIDIRTRDFEEVNFLNHPRFKKYIEAPFRKPDIGMLQDICYQSDLPKNRILYVGDRPDDQQAADRFGCRFLEVQDWWEE